MTRSLLVNEGIFAGGSSGAVVIGAMKYARKLTTPKRILVILPDSGNRYASKIYNDDWMRENNYVNSNFNVLIREALNSIKKEKSNIVMVEDSENLKRAVSIMEEHGISQLPVTTKGKVVGVLSESEIMRPIFEGKLNLNDSVSVAYHNRYEIFNSNDLLDKVINSLMKKNIVLITENDKITHILTSSDILLFISMQGRY
ncbi:MAG: CBS domain-containing protein [Bacteriovoracaceae bacterium]